MLDPELLGKAQDQRNRLLDLQHEVERARTDYHDAIRRLNAAGATLREIADELGLSHQRVHQIVDVSAGEAAVAAAVHPSFPPFLGRGRWRAGGSGSFFQHFSDEARQAIVRAQDEAVALRRSYIGTEHLLLGLLRLETGVAADALRSLGITHEAARAELVALVGEGGPVERTGKLPFTAPSKKSLELAFREQRARKLRCIEPELLLLVLARDPELLSAQLLERLGATADQVEAAIQKRLAA